MDQNNALANTQAIEILELLPDAVILVDQSGTIKYTNSVVTELFGYTKKELYNNTVDVLLPNRFKANHAKHRDGYNKKPEKKFMSIRDELFGQTKKGKEIPVEISLGPIVIKEARYVICILRETSSRHYTQMLENKNKELEEFTYAASHDLQEPLRTLTSFSSLLTKELSEHKNEEVQKMLGFINSASVRMSELVKALLDYGRIGRKKQLNDIDCNTTVKGVCEDLKIIIEHTNTQINYNNLPTIKGYPIEIRLIFQNLLSNAIKFTKKDSTPIIKITYKDLGEYWEFCVKDNGIGIPENNLDKIFIIFKRLHHSNVYEGTGIGLAHCQKIVNLHHGRIWVESKLNEGSSFYFTIKK